MKSLNSKSRTDKKSNDNNNTVNKSLRYNKDYVSPYSFRANKLTKHSPRDDKNRHTSTMSLHSSNRNIHKTTKTQGSVPNINSRTPKSSEISTWVSVPNVSHKPLQSKVSPRDRDNILKNHQAYSCSSLNKHSDLSNQIRTNQSAGR